MPQLRIFPLRVVKGIILGLLKSLIMCLVGSSDLKYCMIGVGLLVIIYMSIFCG